MITRRKLVLAALAASLASGITGLGQAAYAAEGAADYPNQPINLVVGFAPGGATDIVARLVADKLGKALGQPVIVENKPGGGSNIAADRVVRAAPDGYTLLVETIANATNMSIYKNLNYDTSKDLVHIVHFMSSPSVFVVNPKIPAKTMAEFIALAKSQPGKLTFASSGTGGSPHLAGEMLKIRAGIDMLHIPYKGASPALTDVVAGVVDSGFKTSLGAMPQIQNGQLRALAVATTKRLDDIPDVPTMAEAGIPDFEVVSWNGLAAPAGTPDAIVQKLNREVNEILKMPDVRDRLLSLGAEPIGGSSEEYTRYVESEIKKWGEVVKTAGISID